MLFLVIIFVFPSLWELWYFLFIWSSISCFILHIIHYQASERTQTLISIHTNLFLFLHFQLDHFHLFPLHFHLISFPPFCFYNPVPHFSSFFPPSFWVIRVFSLVCLPLTLLNLPPVSSLFPPPLPPSPATFPLVLSYSLSSATDLLPSTIPLFFHVTYLF